LTGRGDSASGRRLAPAAFEGSGGLGDGLEHSDADAVRALHGEEGHEAEGDHGFGGVEGEEDFGTGFEFDVAVLLPGVDGHTVDVLKLAGAHVPLLLTERLADEGDGGEHAVPPEVMGVGGAFGHFLKLEFFEGTGVLAIGLPEHEAGEGEADATGFGEGAKFVPDGVFGLPFVVVAEIFGVFDTEEGGVSGGEEGSAGKVSEHGDAGEEFDVVDPGAKVAVAAEEGEGLGVGGSGGEEVEEAGKAEVAGDGEIGEEFGFGDVEDVDFELGVCFDVADDVLETAPGGFEVLEERVVEEGAHLAAGFGVELGEELLLLGILAGDEVGSDEIANVGEEGITGPGAAGGGRIFGFVGDLIEEAAGDDGAGGLGFGTGFGDEAAEDFVGGLFEGFGIFEAAAHGAKGGEKFTLFVEAIGVEVLEFGEGEVEFGSVVTGERETEVDAEGGGEGFDFIPIDEDGTAPEDRFDDATAGATGKIPHNENLEGSIGFGSGVDAALARFDVQQYTHA